MNISVRGQINWTNLLDSEVVRRSNDEAKEWLSLDRVGLSGFCLRIHGTKSLRHSLNTVPSIKITLMIEVAQQ